MKRKEKYKDILELIGFNNKLTSLSTAYLTASPLSKDNLMQEIQKTIYEINDWLEEEI